MKKRFAMKMLVASCVMMFCASAAMAQMGGGKEMPKGADKFIKMLTDALAHRYVPVVMSLKIGPALKGKPVTVTVQAGYDDKRAIDKVTEVSIFYSVDGGKYFNGPVILKKKNAKTFAGQIPAIAKAGKVILYPRVKDSYGNVGVELPCKVKQFPTFEDGCMVQGAVDKDPTDDPKGLIENDFDIWDIKVGMDDSNVYINQNVEGKVSKGTMSPQKINAYMAILFDTKELYSIKDLSDFMPKTDKNGKEIPAAKKPDFIQTAYYAPLAKALGGDFKTCAMIRLMNNNKPAAKPDPKNPKKKGPNPADFMDAKNITCKAEDTDLYIKINKAALLPTEKNSLSLVGALTGYMPGGESPMPVLKDVTMMTRISFKSYSFVVK